MTTSPEQLNQLLFPLIGSFEARLDFAQELRDGISTGEHSAPYFALNSRLRTCIEGAAGEVEASRLVQGRLIHAACVSGVMVVGLLEGFGNVYHQEADMPQELERVLNNVKRITSYAVGMAHASGPIGLTNRLGLEYGVDPASHSVKIAISRRLIMWGLKHPLTVSRKSLVVKTDEAGQLDIDFRYNKKRPLANNDRMCPVANLRLDPEDSDKFAIPTFSNLIGAVVATEIYPKVFDIMEPE